MDPDYRLTPEQIQEFDESGYLVLRNRVNGPVLSELQTATAKLVERGNDDMQQGRTGNADWVSKDGIMYRVNYIHDKGQRATVDLLGAPSILGIAESLAGRNFVPTWESLVFKDEGQGIEQEWHRDTNHSRRYRIFNVGVYLDRSSSEEGALRVLPGTQSQRLDELELNHGWNSDSAVTIEARPGDVVVHDVMVLHGSPGCSNSPLRRTIYFEFRSAKQITSEGPWSRAWVERRHRLAGMAIESFADQYPLEQPYKWRLSASWRCWDSAERDVGDILRVEHGI